MIISCEHPFFVKNTSKNHLRLTPPRCLYVEISGFFLIVWNSISAISLIAVFACGSEILNAASWWIENATGITSFSSTSRSTDRHYIAPLPNPDLLRDGNRGIQALFAELAEAGEAGLGDQHGGGGGGDAVVEEAEVLREEGRVGGGEKDFGGVGDDGVEKSVELVDGVLLPS